MVAKVAGGTTVLGGGIGGAGYAAYSHYNSTIKDYLGLDFLDTSDNIDVDSEWDKLFESYKQADNSKKFKGATSIEDKSNLKSKCREFLDVKLKFNDNTDLQQQVKDWCTSIKDVEDALTREGKTVFEKDDPKFLEVFKAKKEETDFKGFLSEPNNVLDETKHLNVYKSKCKKALEEKFDSDDYKASLDNARILCSY